MGLIYLYTGEGAGKTTNALGLALRSVGHEKKVVIIQFLKGRKEIGEYKIRERLKPYYEIYQFGSEDFVDPKNLEEEDYKSAKKGLEFAKEKLKEEPNLLVLDEINLVVKGGLIEIEEVLEFLENIPEKTTLVLTGRYAPEKLREKADFVNIIADVKHPEEMPTEEGIQY